MILKLKQTYSNMTTYYKNYKQTVKKYIFGMKAGEGILYKIGVYIVLCIFGFVFLYPLIYMFSTSMMSNLDLVDNSINWIPSRIFTFNYEMAWKALKLPGSYFTTIGMAGVSTLSTALASALVGYGLVRFEFKGKKLVFALMLLTFMLPKTLFFIPRYQIFSRLNLIGTVGALLVPAITGQGEQGALFILIFYQFFKMIPKSLEEAARIDGAGPFKTFWKISIPMAIPAFIIVVVYGFALYWNETLLTSFYIEGKIQTVPMLLSNLESNFSQIANQVKVGDLSRNPNLSYTEAKVFAGTILSIIPLAAMYLFVQRWFVESIDKTGITGE